jgi:hypothetical protein
MPPGCGDANQAISRAKIRDTGIADTGSAEDGGTDTGSADAGSAGYTGGGEDVSATGGAGGATVLMVVRAGIQAYVPKICTPRFSYNSKKLKVWDIFVLFSQPTNKTANVAKVGMSF